MIAHAKIKTDGIDAAVLAKLYASGLLLEAAAIGDIERFSGPQKLVAYLGLNPSVRQSGEGPAYHGAHHQAGSCQARRMLVEGAWAAARSPGPLRAFYRKIAARRGQHIAVVATARKFAMIIWHMLTKETDYIWAPPALMARKLRSAELRACLPITPNAAVPTTLTFRQSGPRNVGASRWPKQTILELPSNGERGSNLNLWRTPTDRSRRAIPQYPYPSASRPGRYECSPAFLSLARLFPALRRRQRRGRKSTGPTLKRTAKTCRRSTQRQDKSAKPPAPSATSRSCWRKKPGVAAFGDDAGVARYRGFDQHRGRHRCRHRQRQRRTGEWHRAGRQGAGPRWTRPPAEIGAGRRERRHRQERTKRRFVPVAS